MPQDDAAPVLAHRGRRKQTSQSGDDYSLLARWMLALDVSCDARLARTDVAVMMAILDHMNRKTGLAFPSIETIAVEAKVNRRTVVRSIERLVEVGHLVRIRGSGRRPNYYRMPARSSGEFTTTTVEASAADSAVAVVNRVRSSGELTSLTSLEPERAKRTDALASADGALSIERSKGKSESSSQTRVTFDAWLDSIPEGIDVFADDDSIHAYRKKVGLPFDYLVLAWQVFMAQQENSPARSADWRAVFRRHVRNGCLGLWTYYGDAFRLTTRGKQAAIEHDMRDLVADSERSR